MPQHFHADPIPGKQGPSWVLKWDKPAHSDLPIQRYKVFWSRRISIGSLIMHHHTLTSVSTYGEKELRCLCCYSIVAML
jgi:hypothetical protein